MNKLRTRAAKIAVIDMILATILAAPGVAQEKRPSPPASSGGTSATPATSGTSSAEKGAFSSPEKVVLKVGNEQMTQAEFDALIGGLNPQMAQMTSTPGGRRRIGEQYANLLVLSQQALIDHLDSAPDFRRQLAVSRLQLLANSEMANLTRRVEPKPEEINAYYSSHQSEFEEAKARKVFIRKKPEGAKEGAPGLTAQEAKTRAETIRKALVAGTDPKKVVEDYRQSTDVLIDLEPRTIRHGMPPAEVDKAAFALKDGELSEIQETPQAITFMQVVSHGHRELKEVTSLIQRKLKDEKLKAAMDDLKNKAAVWMDEEYFKPAPPPAATTSPGATPSPAPVTPPPTGDKLPPPKP